MFTVYELDDFPGLFFIVSTEAQKTWNSVFNSVPGSSRISLDSPNVLMVCIIDD